MLLSKGGAWPGWLRVAACGVSDPEERMYSDSLRGLPPSELQKGAFMARQKPRNERRNQARSLLRSPREKIHKCPSTKKYLLL